MRKITLLKLLLLTLVLGISTTSFGQIVISQVYGGGGNSGATLKNDFIELYNRGASAITLNGWSVQYAGASSSFSASNTQVIPDGTTIQPGKYFLIQCAKGNGGTADLPTPDLTSTLALGGTNGKIALCNSSTPLTTSDFTNTSPTGTSIVDFVGYGSANQYEGTGAVAALSNTTAAIRMVNGTIDTNNNNADFNTGTPNPRNSAYSMLAAAVPTFSPESGNYTTTQNVSISSTTVGAKIYYTTDGSTPDNTKTLYQNPITVSTTTTIKAIAYDLNNSNPSMVATAVYTFPTEVANIAALRAASTPGFYKLTGEAILTLKSATRNAKYIQDQTGAVLIDDNSGVITTAYNLGDGISGIIGSTALYNGMLQFTPVTDPGAATSTGKTITPTTLTLAELLTHQAELVKVSGVTISDITGGTGKFVASTSYNLNANTNPVLRTQYADLDYIGQNIPTTPQDIVGVVLVYNTTAQLVPRSLSDMITTNLFTPRSETLNIWLADGKVNFNAAQGETVEVFNAVGQRLLSQTTVEGKNSLNIQNRGVTVVKVANRVGKVVL